LEKSFSPRPLLKNFGLLYQLVMFNQGVLGNSFEKGLSARALYGSIKNISF
jgi:hypothetical protein